MFIEILKYGFLIIFFATAIIGIASIPNWIKIPEYYRKRIFIALILEVVGVIIILFRQEMIIPEQHKPDVSISTGHWVVMDKNAEIVTPVVTIKACDTIMTKKIVSDKDLVFTNIKGELSKTGYEITNSKGKIIANISTQELVAAGLFNSFKTAKNEISSTENYSYIKWEKHKEGRWRKRGDFIGPFTLKVADYNGSTYYSIYNTADSTTVFDSSKKAKNMFSVDNRIIHFYEYNNVYYMLRISWADLKAEKKYVNIINVRIEPSLNL